MKIELNGQSTEVKSEVLENILKELGYDKSNFATAVNGTFVPQTERNTYILTEGDRIEIVVPMQGG